MSNENMERTGKSEQKASTLHEDRFESMLIEKPMNEELRFAVLYFQRELNEKCGSEICSIAF